MPLLYSYKITSMQNLILKTSNERILLFMHFKGYKLMIYLFNFSIPLNYKVILHIIIYIYIRILYIHMYSLYLACKTQCICIVKYY